MKLSLFIGNVSSLNQYDSSEPVYFVKVEAKGICEEIMTDAYLTVCSYHVTYAFQSESTLYSCLNVKELLARSRREI